MSQIPGHVASDYRYGMGGAEGHGACEACYSGADYADWFVHFWSLLG